MRIARQFTAGFELAIAQVPQGRLNPPMSYVSSHSHCVFSTKDWRPFITPVPVHYPHLFDLIKSYICTCTLDSYV